MKVKTEEKIAEELKIPIIDRVEVKGEKRLYAVCKLHELIAVCKHIKNTGFDHLSVIICVDHKTHFLLVYEVWSTIRKVLLTLETQVNENESVPSVTGIWRSANWHEREIYDMFGIKFDNHPDLRRILLPEDTMYFPLRKSFPYPWKKER